jgi:HK97 family phage portal protein
VTVIVSSGRMRSTSLPGLPRGAPGLMPIPIPGAPSIHYMAPHPFGLRLLHGDRPWVTYEHLVRSIPVLFSVVTRLCYWTARIPFQTFIGEFAEARQLDRDSDLARLFRKPNRSMRWNAYVRDWLGWDYYTMGNSFALKSRPSAGAPPDELLPIPWKWVFPIYDAGERIVAYEIWLGATSPVGGGELILVTPDQVVHNRWPRGIGPMEALTRSLGIEDAALTYQAESLRNGVMPRQAFSTDKVLHESDYPRLRKELDKLYAGVENAGRYAIFDHDLKPAGTVGISPEDVALEAQRKLTQHDVAAAFDVSPMFLGMFDPGSRGDAPTYRSYQFRDSLGPKIDALQADFLAQLIDPEPAWADLDMFLMPDMDSMLMPDPKDLAQIDLWEQQSSTTTSDERRRRRGLPPDGSDEAKKLMVPLNMRPIDSPPPTSEGAMRRGPGAPGVAAPGQ